MEFLHKCGNLLCIEKQRYGKVGCGMMLTIN